MEPEDTIQEPETDGGYADLSSLVDEVSSEPEYEDLSPTQAISDDGQVVELGENGVHSIHKDI